MKKLCTIIALLSLVFCTGNVFAQTEMNISWSDHGTAILDSIGGAKYILAGVDVDKDGKKEFIVPIDYGVLDGKGARQIAVFENVGDDDYELVWSYLFPGEAAGELTQPAVGDLDGDGNLEILAIHVQPEEVDPTLANFYVFECVGDNDYGTEPTVSWDLGDDHRNNIRCAAAADMDNDGKDEIILTSRNADPGVVIASVSDFDLPVWTKKHEDSDSYEAFDMASVAICDMDGDGYKEAVMTPLQDAAQLDLYIVEYDGSDFQLIKPAPSAFFGKGALHALDVADLDNDGKDELYIGAVERGLLYVVTKPTGDILNVGATDIHFIGKVEHPDYEADTGWMPGGTLGDPDGDGNMSFLGSASGTVGCGVHDWEYQGGDVTSADSWDYSYISIDLGWGTDFFIYGIDFAEDMDGDGKGEILVARGNANIGHTAPVVYVTEFARITGVSPELSSHTVPEVFILKQNYPNPFNPTTQISYEVYNSSKISLEIYNIFGQKVRTLIDNRYHQNGTYNISWNALDNRGYRVSSGVYFYTLRAGDFIDTKKMVLIR